LVSQRPEPDFSNSPFRAHRFRRSVAGLVGGLASLAWTYQPTQRVQPRRKADYLVNRVRCIHISSRSEGLEFEMSLLLNVLWLVFGGIWMAAGWLLAAVIMAVTIVGIPWARAAANIALYTLLPFGHSAVDREEYSGRPSIGTGPLGILGNLVWLLLAGWWLALAHLITAVGLAITIIGLPFAWAHLKLAGLALWPIGKEIVSNEAIRRAGTHRRSGLPLPT
jgi:uncharacterized membrane protein YccF (DUF307 family)